MAESTLATLVRARGRAEGQAWLDETIAGAAAGTVDVRVAFPAVARHVGRVALDAGAESIDTELGAASLAAWRVDDAARVLILLAAARRDPGGALALARELYQLGDNRERTAALRALALLPGAAHDDAGLPAVLDAMRINQGEIFEAAILDNPYASRHLPQHEWRKAVLKAVFVGHSIRRVVDLDRRADAELAASLIDLATEREAATRAVPPELWPVAALHPPPGLAAKLLGYLEHPAPEHRAAAATALGRLRDPRVRPFLVDRAERERDDAVRDALRAALA